MDLKLKDSFQAGASNVVSLNSVQLARYIKEINDLYGNSEFARIIRRIHGEEFSNLAESGRPYLELFYGVDERYRVQVYLLGFIVDEWTFKHPKDCDFSNLLTPNLEKFVVIPWDKLRSGRRGSSNEFSFFGVINQTSRYWVKAQMKIIEKWEKEKEEQRNAELLSQIEEEIETINGRIEDRICTLDIYTGIHEGKDGFFGRYSRNGEAFCIRFCREIYRGHLNGFLDRDVEQSFRIPWKTIREGTAFSVEIVFCDIFKARIGSGYVNDCIFLAPEFELECERAAELDSRWWEIKLNRPRHRKRRVTRLNPLK